MSHLPPFKTISGVELRRRSDESHLHAVADTTLQHRKVTSLSWSLIAFSSLVQWAWDACCFRGFGNGFRSTPGTNIPLWEVCLLNSGAEGNYTSIPVPGAARHGCFRLDLARSPLIVLVLPKNGR
eukprot:259276-Amphidinium_carterae.1